MKLQLSQFFLPHLTIKDVYNGALPPERKSNIMHMLFLSNLTIAKWPVVLFNNYWWFL